MKRFAAFVISAAVMLSGYAGNVQVFAAADSKTDEYEETWCFRTYAIVLRA